MTEATAKQPPDWERIEEKYRLGIKSIREIACEHGIAESYIRKRAGRQGWERDLSGKVRAKSDALVRMAEVRSAVRSDSALTERALIDGAAQIQASVEMGQRADAARARRQAMRLLAEVEAQTDHAEALREMGECMAGGGEMDNPKAMAAFMAVLSLPGRTKTMALLGDTINKLVMLERAICRQDEQPLPPPPKPTPIQVAVILPGDGQRAYMDMIARGR